MQKILFDSSVCTDETESYLMEYYAPVRKSALFAHERINFEVPVRKSALLAYGNWC